MYQYFIVCFDEIVVPCMGLPHFVYLLMNIWVVFTFLNIIINAAVNICVQDFVQACFHFS